MTERNKDSNATSAASSSKQSRDDQIKTLLQDTITEYATANEGVDQNKMRTRARELHTFLASWTKPGDLFAMTILSKKKAFLENILKSAQPDSNVKNLQEFLDEMVSGVIHLYALAEARMQADLEKEFRRATKDDKAKT